MLEVSSSRLFLPSAAALYLLQEGSWPGAGQQQEELLELEGSHLYPLVVAAMASSVAGKQGPDPGIIGQIKAVMQLLESR